MQSVLAEVRNKYRGVQSYVEDGVFAILNQFSLLS